MQAPSWQRVKEITEAALSRPPEQRAAFVVEACGGDPSLQSEIESLLAAIEQAGSFIERPALPSLSSSAVLSAGWIPDLGGRRLEPGDSLGPYRIVEFIAAGGMGEVYRAHDANLERDVALKVRPAAFALEDDRFALFSREAQILAALNHPNIAAIHGVERCDAVQALVLELVEGPTLASRIARGRIPVDEALAIAIQIAEGLEAAHKRGITHNDLKPANIKLRPDGIVKILDFGLAKALDAAAARGGSESDSSAVASSFHAGLIFGTAAYMSPEQARGEPVDARTDVWAFGCVLYETLAGRPAFSGATVQDVLEAVRNREPDWSLLPAETPAGVVKLLRKCLEKNADRRLHHIADARIELEDARVPAPAPVPRARGRRAVWLMAGAAVIAILGGVWAWKHPASSAPEAMSTVKRLQIPLDKAGPLAPPWSMPLAIGQLSIAISPDGTRLVYVLERQGVTQLYLRALDQLEAAPIPGTEGGFGPFFSPDGRWIGFFSQNKLKKVAVSGGEPIELCAAPNPYGGSWGTDGTILFAPDEGRRPARVRETGGEPQRILVKPDHGAWRRPDILPDGKAAIVSNPLVGVGVLTLETGEFRVLVEGAGGGRYAAGHLIFARPGVLLAARFDPERRALTGPEAVVLEGVRTESQVVVSHPQAAFSRDGTLVYASGGAQRSATRPVWVDRRGSVEPLPMPPRNYRSFSLSPDGRFLAIIIADPKNDLWVQDLRLGTLTRRTSGLEPERVVWTPDGERLVFGSRRGGGPRAFWMPKDGSREPEPFLTSDGQPAFGSFSPDGQLVATFRRDPTTGLDLWVLRLKGAPTVEPYLRTRFTEAGPSFSPDGRWIAYGSDESGQYEVYVRPYPARDRKWQVSTQGGEEPIWSHDGKELFYRNGRRMMAAAVNLSGEFTSSPPRLLFEGPYVNIGGISYDVTPDGQRFLLLEATPQEPVTHLNVVLNWFEEVKRKAGSASN
jgi:Tol biopolymer transport system component